MWKTARRTPTETWKLYYSISILNLSKWNLAQGRAWNRPLAWEWACNVEGGGSGEYMGEMSFDKGVISVKNLKEVFKKIHFMYDPLKKEIGARKKIITLKKT